MSILVQDQINASSAGCRGSWSSEAPRVTPVHVTLRPQKPGSGDITLRESSCRLIVLPGVHVNLGIILGRCVFLVITHGTVPYGDAA